MGQERADTSFYRSYAGGPQGAKYRAGAGFDPSDRFATCLPAPDKVAVAVLVEAAVKFDEFKCAAATNPRH